jgi:anti-sigma B factor antagonist
MGHNRQVGSDHTDAEGQSALSISGELDVGSVASVRQMIAAMDGPVVRVDTRDLTFIDSTGLAGLLDAQAALAREGRRLQLLNCPLPLTRLLQITALTGRFGET